MMSQKLPSFWIYFWISLILGLLGWGGLVLLILLTLPTLGPRWMFFFLLFLALSGSAMPITYFLNRRFPVDPPVEGGVVVREAMWIGVYGSIVAWLQMGRVLTSGLALVLAIGLLLVELLLRLGERSAWSPASEEGAAGKDAAGKDAAGKDAAGKSTDEEDVDGEDDEDEDE